MKDYMIECKGNCCFRVYKRRKFLFIGYWSLMCNEVTLERAVNLVDSLRLIDGLEDKNND